MRRSHAVVVGASMGGLGSARALANHFERVTVVERDLLPAAAATRKGVPQGGHAHGLLPSGFRIIDEYFPGLADELVEAGATRGDLTGDFLWFQYGTWKLRKDSGLGGIVLSRPLLESRVRARVRALPNVTILERHDGKEPVFDAATGRVTGLRVHDHENGEDRVIDGDLVVDATGRGSQAPRWLKEWGFGEVRESTVRVDVGYATAVFERRAGDLHGAMGAIIAGTAPESTRYAAVLGAEGPRWVATLVGALRDYPPTDVDEWKAFARTLPTTEVADLAEGRTPQGPILSYCFPANQQRHYDEMTRFPEGYLIAGDAVCSFNPIYGQGMSVAFSEARALDDTLRKGDAALARAFFARVKDLAAGPWAIATGEDYRFPQVEGKRPPGFALISRYMERAHRAAAKDEVVLRRFFEVASLLAPPTAMMAKEIAWRVALGGRGARPPTHTRKVQI